MINKTGDGKDFFFFNRCLLGAAAFFPAHRTWKPLRPASERMA
jgi:hypothetical protein